MRGKRAKEIKRLAKQATTNDRDSRRLYKRIKTIVKLVGAKKLSE